MECQNIIVKLSFISCNNKIYLSNYLIDIYKCRITFRMVCMDAGLTIKSSSLASAADTFASDVAFAVNATIYGDLVFFASDSYKR